LWLGMVAANRCLVCGRPFPEGQGIVVKRGKIYLSFHSSRCAAKFLRMLVMDSEEIGCLEGLISRLVEELERALKSSVAEKKL